MANSTPPPLSHMLETCIYVKSMDQARDFYTSVFGLQPLESSPRITVLPLDRARNHVLLLFQLGLTAEDNNLGAEESGNLIPGHGPTESLLKLLMNGETHTDGTGGNALKQHFCFAVNDRDEVLRWAEHLKEKGVPITGRVDWGERGYSVYFFDPDGNVGEVASRRLWELL